ncbi:phosphatidate cytidylyltransferase [Leadbettera azotonutricia]|uniref:Phosphatidate cytidylyltransferase n=1 Tax=Leadbettera azotonutricia (strain ATCC BAA-888 / DSM 13862 / ZAS-9) TaxID=545695 RepID=F5YB08_LEAAZ|nr:phosphatidate cytidylyltransferase [Leadbettera azotonutricia]AEF80466.1 phosphatidate cytidylyltransferase [Leadbettera azotonutricia ZAS-9]
MKKLLERLLVFFVGIPALIGIVFFLPQLNHAVFNCMVIWTSIAGAMEFQNILKQKNIVIGTVEAAIFGGIAPVVTAAVVSFNLNIDIISLSMALSACWIVASRVFSSQNKLDSYVNRTAAGFAVLIYPGFLMSWIIRLAAFPRAEVLILFFLLVTFLNDGAAWLSGRFLGKNNRGIIAASPNKSLAGFAGGIASSMALGIIGAVNFPDAFNSALMPGAAAGAILGLASGIASTLGDLGESALKRSAGVKDSGTVIPGRGGMLDSIDSLALTAPVYYLAYVLLFT